VDESGSGAATALIGYSVSTNKGASFTDKTFPTVPGDPTVLLGFDQVMTCTSAKNFYFSSLYNSATETAVSVSASSDGGQTFGAPIIAASSSGADFFDADWMAVNPANPQQLFVTYTDEDFSGFFGGPTPTCPNELGTSIKMVSSNNGGSTWSSPVTVANEVCINTSSSDGAIVEFSQVAIDPRGTAVYVAWESFSGGMNLPTREIDTASAPPPTTSFGGLREGQQRQLRRRIRQHSATVWLG
jgi:hypothetical protein